VYKERTMIASWHRLAAGIVIGLLPLSAGCPGPTPSDEAHAAATVVMQNTSYQPNLVTIGAGETVRWENQDLTSHTVTSGNPDDTEAGSLFDSQTIPPGGAFAHTFDHAGTYDYFCRFHPVEMQDAVVIVIP
jgi:plastocyanin